MTVDRFRILSVSEQIVDNTVHGHSLAVRKAATSPYDGNLLASASYNMTVRVGDWAGGRCLAVWNGRSEFVVGVEWSLFGEGWIESVETDLTTG